jgi:hypothetical protein
VEKSYDSKSVVDTTRGGDWGGRQLLGVPTFQGPNTGETLGLHACLGNEAGDSRLDELFR